MCCLFYLQMLCFIWKVKVLQTTALSKKKDKLNGYWLITKFPMPFWIPLKILYMARKRKFDEKNTINNFNMLSCRPAPSLTDVAGNTEESGRSWQWQRMAESQERTNPTFRLQKLWRLTWHSDKPCLLCIYCIICEVYRSKTRNKETATKIEIAYSPDIWGWWL